MIIPPPPKPTLRSILTQLLIFALSLAALIITCTHSGIVTGSAIAERRSVTIQEPTP